MAQSSEKAVSIIVSGRVQGVGFRYFARHQAEELRITGWVRNTPDGQVQIEAEGNAADLELFINRIKTGPSRAIVGSISINEMPPAGYKSFFIR